MLFSTTPLSDIMTAAPGSMSYSNSYPRALSAELSEATIKDSSSFLPTTSGRIPFASLKATKPTPPTIIVTAKPPSHLSYTLFRASKTCLFCKTLKLVLDNSYAKRFNNTSESD